MGLWPIIIISIAAEAIAFRRSAEGHVQLSPLCLIELYSLKAQCKITDMNMTHRIGYHRMVVWCGVRAAEFDMQRQWSLMLFVVYTSQGMRAEFSAIANENRSLERMRIDRSKKHRNVDYMRLCHVLSYYWPNFKSFFCLYFMQLLAYYLPSQYTACRMIYIAHAYVMCVRSNHSQFIDATCAMDVKHTTLFSVHWSRLCRMQLTLNHRKWNTIKLMILFSCF